MEFLRFGSSIPGSYWGCCCGDIVQNFKVDPDAPYAIEVVGGDGGNPCLNNEKPAFVGMTYKEVFLSRLRFGTFSTRDMPNHFFFAVLTKNQLSYPGVGTKWLAILREAGFEFIRAVANSVGTGGVVADAPNTGDGSSINYVFALFRNIGTSGIADPFIPPKAWSDLPAVKTEAVASITDGKALAAEQFAQDLKVWNDIGEPKFYTEEECVAAGAEIWLAGRRSENPQEKKEYRVQRVEAKNKAAELAATKKPVTDPFGMKAEAGATAVIG